MGTKYIFALFAILVLNSFQHVASKEGWKSPISEETEEIAYQKLLAMEKSMKESIKKMVDQALPSLMNSNSSVVLSGPCMGSILKAIGALKKMRLWPFLMLDAIGKPSGGTFSGTISALGSYHQCIDIVIPTLSKTRKPDVGQYCIIKLKPTLPPRPDVIKLNENVFPHINATFKTELMTTLRDSLFLTYDEQYFWGLCLPSTCTKDDLNQILEPMSDQMGLEASIGSCEIKEPVKIDIVQIAIISAISAIIFLNIVSSVYHEIELYRSKINETKPSKSLLFKASSYFSMRQNFMALMNTKEAAPGTLSAMNGIRVITMSWILLFHAYALNDPHLLRENTRALEYFRSFSFQFILNGLPVITFFFLSAVLVAFNAVKRHDSGKSVNPLVLLFRRIFRLLPCLLLAIGVSILGPLSGSGPLFKDKLNDNANLCRRYWWRNLLFISNFYDFRDMCERYTWYLTVDVQCFIFSLVYIFILLKNEATAKLFLVLATIGSCAATAFVTYAYSFPPAFLTIFVDAKFFYNYMNQIYIKPYIYFGVYAIGLYLGTFLARASKIQINKMVNCLGWITSFGVGLTIAYIIYPWNLGEPYSILDAISYASLHKLGWALCLAWVIFACFSGHGGIINSFLSWPGFQPLANLSFVVYLTHDHVYKVYNYSLQGPQDFTHVTIVFNFFGCLVISHIIAAFVRILYEYPFMRIDLDTRKYMEPKSSTSGKGRAMSVELHKVVLDHTQSKYDDVVELNKVTVNGIEFSKENGIPKDNPMTIPNGISNYDNELIKDGEECEREEICDKKSEKLENVSDENLSNENNEIQMNEEKTNRQNKD